MNVVLRGKLIAVNAYIKKSSKMDNITLYHEELERKAKLKALRRKEYGLNKIESRKTIERFNKTLS